MSRYRRHTLSLATLAVVVMVVLFLVPAGDRDAQSRNTLMLNEALNNAIKLAEQNFYKEIDREKMYEGAIRGALAALDDPYTFYQPPMVQKREAEDLFHAKFGGLGIRILPDKGVIKIARPLPNTPAMRAGLQAGDYIIKVDGEPISIKIGGQTLDEVVEMLRGEVGSQVTVTIQRRGHPEAFDVTLTRAEIKIDSVESTMLEDGVGYINIHQFTGRTGSEFAMALNSLKGQGLKSLILDLRDNGGGLLSAAKDVADAFLSDGLIVYTKGRKKKFDQEYPADPLVLCPPEVDVVVLVNEYSASGSEIVAGAIKDSKRGILLGTTTFGKGVVQQRFALPDDTGAVSLTISSYYTPSGVSINETGITPNVEVEPEKLDTTAAVMRNKMRVGQYVKDFVEKWVEEKEKETGETPNDFAQLEQDLPKLMETLAENEITLELEIVKIDARSLFNTNVGIYQLLDMDHDNQLLEAIQLIKKGGVQQVLAASAKVTDM